MNLETILNTANTRATQLGLPLVFGDTAVQNVAANDLSGDFFTLDIRRGSYRDTNVPNSVSYSIVVRCMGISAYMRDDAIEIATLIRAEMLLRDFFIPSFADMKLGTSLSGRCKMSMTASSPDGRQVWTFTSMALNCLVLVF